MPKSQMGRHNFPSAKIKKEDIFSVYRVLSPLGDIAEGCRWEAVCHNSTVENLMSFDSRGFYFHMNGFDFARLSLFAGVFQI